MEFRKTIKLEFSDYLAYNLFSFKRMYIQLAITIAVIAPLYVYSKRGTVFHIWIDMFIVFVCAVIVAGLFIMLLIALMKRNLKKQFTSNLVMQAPNDYLLDDTGVHASSEFGSSNIPWQNVFKAAESKEAFLLYIAKMQAFVLPKRLIGPEEEAALLAVLRQHMPPNKLKLKK